MAHLAQFLPEEIEIGAFISGSYGTEKVAVDGGGTVRNNRWDSALRTIECSFPTARRDDAVYLAVLALWENAEGDLHTFNFRDWRDETGGTILRVRFDSPLTVTGVASHLDHIETITLVEEPE